MQKGKNRKNAELETQNQEPETQVPSYNLRVRDNGWCLNIFGGKTEGVFFTDSVKLAQSLNHETQARITNHGIG